MWRKTMCWIFAVAAALWMKWNWSLQFIHCKYMHSAAALLFISTNTMLTWSLYVYLFVCIFTIDILNAIHIWIMASVFRRINYIGWFMKNGYFMLNMVSALVWTTFLFIPLMFIFILSNFRRAPAHSHIDFLYSDNRRNTSV